MQSGWSGDGDTWNGLMERWQWMQSESSDSGAGKVAEVVLVSTEGWQSGDGERRMAGVVMVMMAYAQWKQSGDDGKMACEQ